MNVPKGLTDRLLEFILDNHLEFVSAATNPSDRLRLHSKKEVFVDIERLLADALEDL